MKLKQLSLFLENKPGALSRPIGLLATAKVNIQALSVAESNQFGILRLIVHDWEAVRDLLEKEGFIVKVTDVVAIEVADQPGGLADILDTVDKAHINVEFMYAFTQTHMNRGVLVFRFNNPDEAIRLLRRKGVNVVASVDWLKQSHS